MPIKKNRSDLSMHQQHSAVSWRHFVFLIGLDPLLPLLTHLCSVTCIHGKSETGHVAEMRLMDEATRGGSESQHDKPCKLAHVNSRVTRTEGDSCVSDARRHAAVDRLPPLSV